jgi:hypothetical protein
MADYREVTACRVCGSNRLTKYLYLGNVPLANVLVNASVYEESKKYPVRVLFCQDCALSQLSIVVDPKILYSTYTYHSSVSKTFQDHCYQLGLKLMNEFKTPEHPLVVDIASNDGCLLTQFQKAGFKRLLGFEPAENLAQHPYGWKDGVPGDDMGICVRNSFFSEEAVSKYLSVGSQGASFITAQNVLAHVDDIKDFLGGVRLLLNETGVFVVEVPYMAEILDGVQFDTIYHEHLSYFLLKPLKLLFQKAHLPIFRVERVPIHGGSIRIYASKGAYAEEKSVQDLLDFEKEKKLYDFDTYTNFAFRVNCSIEDFYTICEMMYMNGQTIMGYGASAKGISLLNYCGVTNDFIHWVVDDTPAKQGKLTPGSFIPIVDSSWFEAKKPIGIVLFAWNFAQELMEKTKAHKERGGFYVVPIPEVRVI